MHLLTDENGNPVPHGDHDHDAHGHHGHGHHTMPQPSAPDQMTAVLDYMLKHNQAHAAELEQFSGKLEQMEYEEAAKQVRMAAEEFSKGSLYLEKALSLVKGE